MTWPELVEVAKPLGYVEFFDGHRMYHRSLTNFIRIYGGYDGLADVTTRGVVLFSGPYAEVAEYLKREAER